MAHALSLITIGLFCLIGAIVAIIFTIITFANGKRGKFIWLSAFLVCLAGMLLCIHIFVKKTVNKVESFANKVGEHVDNFLESLSDSTYYSSGSLLQPNEQIKLLKSYYPDSAAVPVQFYYYSGFDVYYRFPLRYPYSIHCNNFKDNGELFDESKVKRFNINDNGEVKMALDKIDKLAFDKNYLLIDRKIASTHSNGFDHQYILFSFGTQKTEEANSQKELFKLAKQKGYKGSRLITIEEYGSLFSN